MQISDEVGWQPRWGSVWGKCDLQIGGNIVYP
jgi:hypothetical protein